MQLLTQKEGIMFGSEILDVIIGLAFIYLLCSLVCSAINEWIARLFALRAKDLEKEFGKMLNGNLKEKLYDHPLIKGITRNPNCIKKLIDWIKKRLEFKTRDVRPAYIDPKLFSMALTDILMREGENKDVFFKNLQDGISKGSVPALQTIVDSVKAEIANAKNSIVAFREKVEDWFNSNMEQLSIWYKQKSRVIIFLIAVPLCAGLNIDTIMITKYLFQNETVRAKLVEAANQYVRAQNPLETQTETKLPPQESPGAVTPQPTNNNEPVTDGVSNDPKVEPKSQPNDNPNPPGKKEDKDPMAMVKKLQANLQELGLPIGWNCNANQKDDIRGKPEGWAEWIVKLLGLFISALAISMGAPFWFDVLKKMIDARKKITPAKKEEKSEPK
jgi:hypothetical protein